MKFELRDIIKTDLTHYAFGYGDKENLFKIMFWDDKEKTHLTILINGYKKEVDVHKTINREGGVTDHESILKISFYSLFRFLAVHSKVQIQLLKKYWFSNTIGIGKLIRIDAVLFPMNSQQNESVFIDKRRKKKFRVKETINISDLRTCYISPQEIYEVKSNSFAVFQQKRGRLRVLGSITKYNHTLYFISEAKHKMMTEEMIKSAIEITKSHNFPSRIQLLDLLEKREV